MTPQSIDAIEARVKTDVLPPILAGLRQESLRRDDDLLEVFDSLQILRMAFGVESCFGIKIDNSELTSENVGTLGRLARFISTKVDGSQLPS